MPLHAQTERSLIRPAHGLDQPVLGEGLGLQPVGNPGDALPMQRVDHDLVAADPVAQTAAKRDGVRRPVSFLEGKIGPADPGHKLAAYLLEYLAGKRTDENLDKYWDRSFAEPAGPRMTG